MPAFSTLQLKNQAGTEVSYSPVSIDPSSSMAKWLGAGASLDARAVVTGSVALPTGKSTRVRTRHKVTIPVMDSITGQKIDEVIVQVDFSIPKNCPLLDRQNARAAMADLLVDPVMVAAIENFESVY